MSNLRAICRPHAVFSSMACCYRSMGRVLSVENHNCSLRPPSSSSFFAVWFDRLGEQRKYEPRVRLNRQRRMVATKASNWTDSKSPYETLELERDADEEQIKVAYRRLAKFYHPDDYKKHVYEVYNFWAMGFLEVNTPIPSMKILIESCSGVSGQAQTKRSFFRNVSVTRTSNTKFSFGCCPCASCRCCIVDFVMVANAM